jgi:hypothetical protein
MRKGHIYIKDKLKKNIRIDMLVTYSIFLKIKKAQVIFFKKENKKVSMGSFIRDAIEDRLKRMRI